MKLRLKSMLPSLLITLLVLIVLEIVSTTLLPLMGLIKYRLPFNVLIVLFLGFKLETPWLAILVFITQYCHSFFSNEGWAIGTFTGTLVCISVSYVRDMIHFNTSLATVVITQLFQCMWVLLVSAMIYIQTGNTAYIVEKLWRFLPEGLAISLLSPFFFSVLDKVWKIGEGDGLGENIS